MFKKTKKAIKSFSSRPEQVLDSEFEESIPKKNLKKEYKNLKGAPGQVAGRPFSMNDQEYLEKKNQLLKKKSPELVSIDLSTEKPKKPSQMFDLEKFQGPRKLCDILPMWESPPKYESEEDSEINYLISVKLQCYNM